MKFAESVRGLRGTLHLNVKRHGRTVERWEDHNVIVDVGRAALAAVMAGEKTLAITHVGVGTGTANALPTDTALTDAVLIPLAARSVTGMQARFGFTIDRETANGLNLREFALFLSDGTMFSHRVRDRTLEKADDMTIEGYWTIDF